MGEIRKVLSLNKLEPRLISCRQIWADLCENIHLHYRNLRLEFSPREWGTFVSAIMMLAKSIDMGIEKKNWRPGNADFLLHMNYKNGLESNSDYYPTRLSVELQLDGTYHIHYRDLRLHLTQGEFMDLRDAFKEVEDTIDKLQPFPFANVEKPTLVKLPIEEVQPYDSGHPPSFSMDKEHRDGIDVCKELIKQGKHIRPIVLDTRGRRMDGFKRYMAQKEMGIKEIEVIVDPDGEKGCQDGLPFCDENDADEVKYGRVKHVIGSKK